MDTAKLTCADCGATFPETAMYWHHASTFHGSTLHGKGPGVIIDEIDSPQDEDKPREEPPPPMVRVVAEHEPNLYGMLGFYPEPLCDKTMQLTGPDGVPHTYYRAKSTRTYVLYKAALTGGGAAGGKFSGSQR